VSLIDSALLAFNWTGRAEDDFLAEEAREEMCVSGFTFTRILCSQNNSVARYSDVRKRRQMSYGRGDGVFHIGGIPDDASSE